MMAGMATANYNDIRTEEVKIEKRRHKRITLNLLGRFMTQDKQEYPCRLLNISPGGAAFLAPIDGEIGQKIIVYLDHIGRLEGKVVRIFSGGFALQFMATRHKQEKLAEQLIWLSNKDELELSEERRHDRLVPSKPETCLQLVGGAALACRVIDLSLSGASVELEENNPPIGTEIELGKMHGRIVRHHQDGVGIRFDDVQTHATLSNYFG